MAKHGPFKNGKLIIGGVEFTTHVSEFTVTEGRRRLPHHGHSNETAIEEPGLKEWEIGAVFFQDFAAASVNKTLQALYDAGTKFPMIAQSSADGIAAATPAWSGTAFIAAYVPLPVPHGENLMANVTFAPASDLTHIEA